MTTWKIQAKEQLKCDYKRCLNVHSCEWESTNYGNRTSLIRQYVSQLIWGFETPYGMELLATIHWVAKDDSRVKLDAEAAIASVHHWSDRKRKIFKPQHIQKAWQRLHDQGWFALSF